MLATAIEECKVGLHPSGAPQRSSARERHGGRSFENASRRSRTSTERQPANVLRWAESCRKTARTYAKALRTAADRNA